MYRWLSEWAPALKPAQIQWKSGLNDLPWLPKFTDLAELCIAHYYTHCHLSISQITHEVHVPSLPRSFE